MSQVPSAAGRPPHPICLQACLLPCTRSSTISSYLEPFPSPFHLIERQVFIFALNFCNTKTTFFQSYFHRLSRTPRSLRYPSRSSSPAPVSPLHFAYHFPSRLPSLDRGGFGSMSVGCLSAGTRVFGHRRMNVGCFTGLVVSLGVNRAGASRSCVMHSHSLRHR